jgi:hypothetical protein
MTPIRRAAFVQRLVRRLAAAGLTTGLVAVVLGLAVSNPVLAGGPHCGGQYNWNYDQGKPCVDVSPASGVPNGAQVAVTGTQYANTACPAAGAQHPAPFQQPCNGGPFQPYGVALTECKWEMLSALAASPNSFTNFCDTNTTMLPAQLGPCSQVRGGGFGPCPFVARKSINTGAFGAVDCTTDPKNDPDYAPGSVPSAPATECVIIAGSLSGDTGGGQYVGITAGEAPKAPPGPGGGSAGTGAAVAPSDPSGSAEAGSTSSGSSTSGASRSGSSSSAPCPSSADQAAAGTDQNGGSTGPAGSAGPAGSPASGSATRRVGSLEPLSVGLIVGNVGLALLIASMIAAAGGRALFMTLRAPKPQKKPAA